MSAQALPLSHCVRRRWSTCLDRGRPTSSETPAVLGAAKAGVSLRVSGECSPMPKTKHPLWECPKCGRQFANHNQWHGCTTLTLADCFKGKSDKAVALFRA